LIPALLAIGCSSPQKKDESSSDLIEGYVRAAGKIDHLPSMRERDRCLEELQKRQREEVLAQIRSERAKAQEAKEEVQNRMNTLMVVGRGHSPDEKRFLDEEGPAEMRRLEFRIATLHDLESQLLR